MPISVKDAKNIVVAIERERFKKFEAVKDRLYEIIDNEITATVTTLKKIAEIKVNIEYLDLDVSSEELVDLLEIYSHELSRPLQVIRQDYESWIVQVSAEKDYIEFSLTPIETQYY